MDMTDIGQHTDTQAPLLTRPDQLPPQGPGMILPTVAEIKRLGLGISRNRHAA
ncbi:hypothetical protein ACTWPT_18525 [Nonomuraea sp. 3N208]|uniref:hypothetical protein n=1 Tax=Nonomuraea sp. 3N208 TaxID=3457421 RepID=UPI003FCD0292